jgi:hypothetical protein
MWGTMLCNVFALLCPGLHCTCFKTIKVKLSERGREEKTQKRERRTIMFFFFFLQRVLWEFSMFTLNFLYSIFLSLQLENSPKKMLTIRSTITRFHHETTFALERLNQLDVGWWMISEGENFAVHAKDSVSTDLNENVYALYMFTSCIAILTKNIFSIHYEIIYIVDMNERKNHFSFILMHTIHLLHFLVLVCMPLNMIFFSYVLYDMPHETWTCFPLLNSEFFYISCNNNNFLTIWKIV